MENIEIRTSKNKSIWLLLGSLAFVGLGIWFVVEADSLSESMNRNPILLRSIGVASIIFFGLGIYAGIKRIRTSQLIVIISPKGLNLNPKKSLVEFIAWRDILGFDEINVHGTKILTINVEDPHSWLEKEDNPLRKRLMKYNVENYSSPFNISANGLNISNSQLKETLNLYLNKYR